MIKLSHSSTNHCIVDHFSNNCNGKIQAQLRTAHPTQNIHLGGKRTVICFDRPFEARPQKYTCALRKTIINGVVQMSKKIGLIILEIEK